MDAGVLVPLGFFAVVVLLVAITSLTKLRDTEMQVHQRLYMEELEHQRKMKELTQEFERVKQDRNRFSSLLPRLRDQNDSNLKISP